ncbi:hypothetical protein, partial [Spirosoma sp.]|uniref:hypothetical protein n=1 Tax=Spirosoma sp. TaxID=1899569 RepID=UPI003B3A60B9
KEGDVQGHYGLPAQQKLSDLIKIKNTQPDENIALLNAFTRLATAKGAQVVLTYPAYCKKGYFMNAAELNTLDHYYRQNIICPVIGSPKDFVMNDTLFFDTVYHLTQEGARIRTERLARTLTPVLAISKK